jgi:hypothetical protein
VVGVALQSRWERTKASVECWCTPNVCQPPPAEISAAVCIAAKLAEKLEADVDDFFAALRAVGFDDGHIIEISAKRHKRDSQHRLMPNGRLCATPASRA